MDREIKQLADGLKIFLRESSSSGFNPRKKWIIDEKEEKALKLVIELLEDSY